MREGALGVLGVGEAGLLQEPVEEDGGPVLVEVAEQLPGTDGLACLQGVEVEADVLGDWRWRAGARSACR